MTERGEEQRPAPRLYNMQQIYRLLSEYEEVVYRSPLAQASKGDYTYFASLFVRWLDNDFEPGGTL